MSGPSWLTNSDSWTEQIVIKPCQLSEFESRTIKTVMKTAVPKKSDDIDNLLTKAALWKIVRISAKIKKDLSSIVREVMETADH